MCEMGGTYKRSDAEWYYVRIYWKGEYQTFSTYHGERMTEEEATKLLDDYEDAETFMEARRIATKLIAALTGKQ